MIKDIPLDNRIAVFGIDKPTDFNLYLEWYEQVKAENIFEKEGTLNWLFNHGNWCICCVKDSLKLKDNQVICERLACGRFQSAEFIGPVDTLICRYSESAKIDFLGDPERHYLVFDGTGQILTHSRLVPDLWQPEVFVKAIENSINNIDYTAIEDIFL